MAVGTKEYVLDRIEVDADGHWLWTMSKNNAGYGNATDAEGNRIGAHVLAYKLWKGDYPKEHRIDHRNDCPKHCVFPEHLTDLPHSLNMKLVFRRRFGQMNRRDLRTARLLHSIVTERLNSAGVSVPL